MSRKLKGFFRPILGDLQKEKKKGLRQNSERFFGRNPKFKGFFRPKSGDLQKKKKKKVFAKIQHFRTRGGVEDTSSRPRPRPRTQKKPEAKAKAKDSLSEDRHSRGQDRNARGQGQGPRTQAQCSPKKSLQKFFSGDLQFIGVPRILIWGGLNHKSHAMTSSKFFQRRSFCLTKIS